MSEITTSNNFGHFHSNHSSTSATPSSSSSAVSHNQHRASTIVKIETTSPKTLAATIATSSSSIPTSNMDHTNSNQVQNGMHGMRCIPNGRPTNCKIKIRINLTKKNPFSHSNRCDPGGNCRGAATSSGRACATASTTKRNQSIRRHWNHHRFG